MRSWLMSFTGLLLFFQVITRRSTHLHHDSRIQGWRWISESQVNQSWWCNKLTGGEV
jgi:hypothetical protein